MKKLFWIALSMLLVTQLEAQETLRLSLNESLEIALSDNPTIVVADMEIEKQHYVRRETQGQLYPQLSGSAAYNYNLIRTSIDMGGGQKFSFEPLNVAVGTIALKLPIYAPALYNTLKMNDEQMRAAVESARSSKITLSGEVKTAYYNILLAEASLHVLKASKQNIAQVVERNQALFDNQLASEYDLLTAQVQLSNLEPSIIQVENSIVVTKQLLKMYLSIPQSIELELTDSLETMIEGEWAKDRVTTVGVENNSDIRMLEIQENMLNQQFKIARTSRIPSVAFVSNFQFMARDKISFGSMGGGGALPAPAPQKWEYFTPLSIGIQASIPLFNGMSHINKQRQIKNSITQIQIQRDYLAQGVELKAKTALSNVVTAQGKMRANQATIGQAERGYDISKTRYYAGMGTMLEVNSAELSLTQAKLNYSQAVYDYLAAEAEYAKIMGAEF